MSKSTHKKLLGKVPDKLSSKLGNCTHLPSKK